MFFAIKKGFTVVEMLIVIGMIAGGLLVMYGVISHGLNFVDYTRKKLIALNIAREGMEAVYNIRDTNWTRWSGKRDKCWLKVDPLVDENSAGCEDDTWMQSGKNYILKQKESSSGLVYWRLSGVSQDLNIFDGLDDVDKVFQVCLSGGYWRSCPNGGNVNEGRFFREIKGLGLIDKKNNTSLSCDNGESSGCGDSAAKEFRFCSIVEYMGNGLGKVKMCGVLTNFAKSTYSQE